MRRRPRPIQAIPKSSPIQTRLPATTPREPRRYVQFAGLLILLVLVLYGLPAIGAILR